MAGVSESISGELTLHKFSENSDITAHTVIDRFGSWNKAKDAAGLDYVNKKYSKDEVVEELKEVADKLDKPPTVHEFREHADMSIEPVKRIFHSWYDALKHTGLEPCYGCRGPSERYSDEEILEEIRRIAREEDLTSKKFQENAEMGISIVYSRFGSWNNAKKKAGVEQTNKQKISKKEIKQEIKRINSDIEGTIPILEFDRLSKFCYRTVYRYFDSWNQAKIEALGKEEEDRQKIIEDLREANKQIDGRLSIGKYNEVKEDDYFSTSKIVNLFGTWNTAKEQASLKTRKINHTREELKKKLQEADEEIEGYLSAPKFTENSDLSKRAFVREFGSWSNALMEAGIVEEKEELSREDILEEMKELSEEYDYLSQQDFLKEKDMTKSRFYKYFDSWNDARKEAGLSIDNPRPRKYTNHQILEALQEADEMVDGKLSHDKFCEVNDQVGIGQRLPASRFGSWQQAKEEAGIL